MCARLVLNQWQKQIKNPLSLAFGASFHIWPNIGCGDIYKQDHVDYLLIIAHMQQRGIHTVLE